MRERQATIAEFIGLAPYPEREAMPRTCHDLLPGDTAHQYARSNDNKPGGRDLIGHSSVQAWSAGPLFPCVIAVIERYDTFPSRQTWDEGCLSEYHAHQYDSAKAQFYALPLEARLRSRSFELMLDGHSEEYASLADAEEVARALIGSPFLRAQWSAS